MDYETLLIEADFHQLLVKEKELLAHNGLIKENRIAIREDIPTVQKACVLAEELGHYHTTAGNILDQSKVENRKQERRARLWAYNKMITLEKLAAAKTAGCRNRYEIAEYLEVSEEFLQEAVNTYKEIYNAGCHQYGDYLICFDPLNIYVVTD